MRNKFYTILNILGLSVGMATFVFILFYIRDESGYDKYHEKHPRIHRLDSEFNINNKIDRFAIVPVPMGPAFKLEFPEVKEFVRIYGAGNALIKYGTKEYYEENFYFCDSTIFDVFTHEFILGSPEKSLTEPKTIVLTEKIAKKYFGNENPMGEMLTTGSGNSYQVTGVIRDLPANSHVRFDALLSGATIAEEQGVDEFNSLEPIRFWNIGVYTYILLHENADIQNIYDRFPAFYEKYMKSIGDQINASFQLLTTPLADTHFRTGLAANQTTGNKGYIYIFSAIAVFVLLLAAINYMNMATARSTNRGREVGIRKVSGAYRGQLIRQFIGESVILSVIAMLIAIFAVYLLIPDFNTLTEKTIHFASDPLIFVIIALVAVFTGFLSGIYPAFYLSSVSPVVALKGSGDTSAKGKGWMRRILVVVQFFIAIVMIIATIAVTNQLNFLKNKDLGFNKENVIVLQFQDSAFRSKGESFKKELLQNPDILGVTRSSQVPGEISWIQVMNVEKDSQMVQSSLILAQVDYDFIGTMQMEVIKGRDFDLNMATDDTGAVVINETGARSLGWYDDPVGKRIDYELDLDGRVGRPMKVIGMVKDFNFRSLHNPVEPMIMFIAQFNPFNISIRIREGKLKETLAFIEEKWNDFGAKRPFDYDFLESNMNNMYQNEEKISKIFSIATFLTIFIALLGLLGLSSFIAEQKNKEIGIRKVVGASVTDILLHLYSDFLVLIMVAFVLAVPIAWWRIDVWLKDSFVYYQSIQWYTFLLAGALALIIGIVTISFHIVRAANTNPVDAIKYE